MLKIKKATEKQRLSHRHSTVALLAPHPSQDNKYLAFIQFFLFVLLYHTFINFVHG